MLHIPLLRHGKPYYSLDTQKAVHHRTKEPFVETSLANAGLIRRDLLKQEEAHAVLARIPAAELIAISKRAAGIFLNDALPLGDSMQSFADYVEQLSATTGMPHIMVRRNAAKIAGVMAEIDVVLSGLTRGLDLSLLDTGYGFSGGHALSYFPRADSLGIVLPSNSPGVHSLWVPSFALKIPLVLKPGGSEPWSPYRIIQAMLKAGAPGEAFSFYPTSHEGGATILRTCGRGMVFGDVSATKVWAGDPRVEVHGPGYSKVLIAADQADDWRRHIPVIAQSIAENGGRSCVNASGVWVTKHGDAIAQALAEELAKIQPRAADDEAAAIAPFADAGVASRIDALVTRDLPGARDVTAEVRGGTPRLAEFQGCSYLLPTVVRCDREHALANREFLFPFASVVEVPASELPEALEDSLVLTAITEDPALKAKLLASPRVGRLNFGPLPTNRISWDQPHEGNLFDHLYARRAFQMAS